MNIGQDAIPAILIGFAYITIMLAVIAVAVDEEDWRIGVFSLIMGIAPLGAIAFGIV